VQTSDASAFMAVLLILSVAHPAQGQDRGPEIDRIERAAVAMYDAGAIARAAALWRQAAEAGSRDAMVALAGLIESGDIAEPLENAVAWYRRAADLAEPLAMFRLALIARREPRLVGDDAHEWLCRAAAAGHPGAVRMLRRSQDPPRPRTTTRREDEP